MGQIILSKLDYTRISESIKHAKQLGKIAATEASKLLTELSNAKVVESQDIPADVVTMNSIIKISFLSSDKVVQFQLVYPDNANIKENKISIFSPIATALIGYKVGDEIEWVVPSGLTKIKIIEIIYQPEAAEDFDL